MSSVTPVLFIPSEIILAHIVPYFARDWLYVSKCFHKEAFSHLLHDPRVALRMESGWGLLHKAIVHDSVTGVRVLLSHPRVNVHFPAINETALQRGNYAILKMLAKYPTTNHYILAKIIWWAAEKGHYNLVTELLSDPRLDGDGTCPETIIRAIGANNFNIVQYVLSKFGNTVLAEISDEALLLAVEVDNYNLVELLIYHKCAPSGINNEILRKAVRNKSYKIVQYLLQFEEVDPTDSGVYYINNPSIEEPMGSALEEAIKSKDTFLIEMLVRHPRVQRNAPD
jgi:hypothetical protein